MAALLSYSTEFPLRPRLPSGYAHHFSFLLYIERDLLHALPCCGAEGPASNPGRAGYPSRPEPGRRLQILELPPKPKTKQWCDFSYGSLLIWNRHKETRGLMGFHPAQD